MLSGPCILSRAHLYIFHLLPRCLFDTKHFARSRIFLKVRAWKQGDIVIQVRRTCAADTHARRPGLRQGQRC